MLVGASRTVDYLRGNNLANKLGTEMLGITECSRLNILRLVSLAVGCMMTAGAGPIVAFNVYATAIKNEFNFTQVHREYLFYLHFNKCTFNYIFC